MNTKSKLKAFFDSQHDSVLYIEKYEENIDFFNELLRNGHNEDIEYVIQIKLYKYADSLNKVGKYRKAINVLSEIENDLNKLRGQSKWYDLYSEGVTFHKGVSLGRLKKYSASNKEFKKLLLKTTDNDNFNHWYKSNKKNLVSSIMDKITIIGVIIYLVMMLTEFLAGLEYSALRISGLIIGLLAMTVSYIWRLIIDKQQIKF